MQQRFGQHLLNATDIFLKTQLSFGFVNLKPILPGHVLVSPLRVVKRFSELTQEEVADLFLLVHRIGPVLEEEYQAGSLTIAIQDGTDAGQSVEHVHVHVIPRRKGDFPENDEIYGHINSWNKIDDSTRKPRTVEEMAAESRRLAAYFQ